MATYQGTYGSIKSTVINKLRLDPTDDLTDVGNAVNLAYQQAVQETGCLQAAGTAAMTDGVGSYDLPSQVAWIHHLVVSFADGQTSDPYQQVTLEQVLGQRRTSVAAGQQIVRPVYAMVGQNQLEVWPEPGAGQTMTFWYVYLPDALAADGDIPVIMEPYGSKLLEYGALVELSRFKKDPLLQDYEAAWQSWLTRFQLWLNRREGSSARTFRIGSAGGRIRLADRSADVG